MVLQFQIAGGAGVGYVYSINIHKVDDARSNHLRVLSLELFVKRIIKLSVSLNQTKMVILLLENS